MVENAKNLIWCQFQYNFHIFIISNFSRTFFFAIRLLVKSAKNFAFSILRKFSHFSRANEMRKWSEKNFREEWEIFAKRFLLLAAIPCRDQHENDVVPMLIPILGILSRDQKDNHILISLLSVWSTFLKYMYISSLNKEWIFFNNFFVSYWKYQIIWYI